MYIPGTSREPDGREENVGLLDLEGKGPYVDENQRDSMSSESRSLEEEMAFFELEKRQRGGIVQRLRNLATYSTAPLMDLLSVSSIIGLLVRFLKFLVPSFLQGPEARAKIRPDKIHPTAYLDGLRGLAALVVFFCHMLFQAYPLETGWGRNGTDYQFFRLPIIRLFADGAAAVSLFFVISGYALSYKPIRLIRAGNFHDFGITMSSMTFRRALRLYLPTTISTFMIVVLVRLGAYELTRPFSQSKIYQPLIQVYHPERLPTSYDQLADWAWKTWKSFHIFGWDKKSARNDYNLYLWTIPVEFRCSLYLFLALMGVARLKTKWRYLALAACVGVTFRHNRWELVLFMLGAAIAELDHIQKLHSPNSSKQNSTRAKILLTVGAVLGLYLLNAPASMSDTPGWRWLSALIPGWIEEQGFWYKTWGAGLFVLCVGRLPGWQAVFNSFIVQYLGKISYALYLMHRPSIQCIGYHIEKWALDRFGVQENYNYGYALGFCLIVPITIWLADVFWRAVDVPSVRFAKWVETQLIAKHD